VHDLKLVALGKPGALIGALRHDLEIALDRDLARVEAKLGQQRRDGQRGRRAGGSLR